MKIRLLAVSIIVLIPFLMQAQIIDVNSRPIQEERSRTYDAIHYKVKLNIDFTKKYIQGENTVTLSPLDNNFGKCILDAKQLVVNEVFDANYNKIIYEQTNGKLIVSFAREYNYEDTISFIVKYSISNPVTGLFFIEESATNPLMLSSGSWPDKASHWFPCYDSPNDKVTHEVIVTTNNKYKVLSNGELIDITNNDKEGTVSYHWHQKLPHPTYLSMLSVGPFEVIEDSLGSLPVNYWVYPKDTADAKWIFEITPGIIEFFNNIYGYEYPWAKYDQVVCPRQGGGAEATSATILGEQVIHVREAEQDYSWDGIIAHEIAHQWWGDLITLRTWSHTWMNESFGTYSDYLYTNWDKGEDEGAFNLLAKKNQYLREAHNKYMRPIVFDRYNRIQDNFDSHTYPKGAVVLHLLRRIIGDEPFFRTLSYFLHKHEFKPVDTHDFMIAIKEVTGKNMDWFFNQYIFKPGHACFDISYVWVPDDKKIKIRILQKQDSIQGVPIYNMPINIGIHSSKGKISKELWINSKDEEFEIDSDEKPLLVRFDEGNYLLKEWIFTKSIDELVYQLKHDDVIGRAWAASQLGEFSSNSYVAEQLAISSIDDPFWAVRNASLLAYAKNNNDPNIALLKKLCDDKNSKVRTSALRILGNTSNPDLISHFKKQIKNDDSFLARSEAIRSIGKCKSKPQKSYLRKLLNIESPRNVIRAATEWALSQYGK